MVIMKIMFVAVKDFSNTFSMVGSFNVEKDAADLFMLRELLFFLSLSLSSWPGGRMKSVLLPSLGVSTISQIVSIININGKIKFVVSHARSPDFYRSDFLSGPKSTFQNWSLSGVNAPHPF